MENRFRGLDEEHIQQRKRLIRDVRPIHKQIFDGLSNSTIIGSLIISGALIVFVFPCLYLIALLLSLFLFLVRYKSSRKEKLPFRLPKTAKISDLSDPMPGSNRKKFGRASGIFHLGNDSKANEELWLKSKDVLTHMLVLGTTGSGKTEALVSLSFNALAMGSGFFYIDPKAAPKLGMQIYSIARICGRDDDFRLLSFLTGNKSRRGVTPERISNTNNPFAFGSGDTLTQLLVSLMPKSEGGNAIFSQNGQQLIMALMAVLTDLRDKGKMKLSIETIREYASLPKMLELAKRSDISEASYASLKTFLESVGWQEGKEQSKQPKSLPEQFGYARAYFGLALASFADTYGHIYNTTMGEVDMFDVIKNRRILVVLLPSLEKATQELEQLGKINLSAVRNATSLGLGSKIEGTVDDVLNSLPTNAETPFLSITDEYAAIPTPGYAEVLTQGRGLGVAAIVASQDYAGITKADEKGVEAKQIVGNTKVKLCMKLEDADDTYKLFEALAGEADVLQTEGFSLSPQHGQGSSGGLGINYHDQMNAKLDKVNRVHLRDLQEQIEGEFHAFFNGQVVRGFVFYANPPLKEDFQLRINQFLQIYSPDKSYLQMKYGSVDSLMETLENRIKNPSRVEQSPPNKLRYILEVFDNENIFDRKKDYMGKTIAAFVNHIEKQDKERIDKPDNQVELYEEDTGSENVQIEVDDSSKSSEGTAIEDVELENPGAEDKKTVTENDGFLPKETDKGTEEDNTEDGEGEDYTSITEANIGGKALEKAILGEDFVEELEEIDLTTGFSEEEAKENSGKIQEEFHKVHEEYFEEPMPAKPDGENTQINQHIENAKKSLREKLKRGSGRSSY